MEVISLQLFHKSGKGYGWMHSYFTGFTHNEFGLVYIPSHETGDYLPEMTREEMSEMTILCTETLRIEFKVLDAAKLQDGIVVSFDPESQDLQ